MQAFVGIRRFGGLYSPPGTVPPALILPSKERVCEGQGIKAASTFEEAKVLVKQMKGLGISQAGPAFELHVSVSPEGMGQAL